MTLEQYCIKYDKDYKKILTTLKECMIEDSLDKLYMTVYWYNEELSYKAEYTIYYLLELNNATLNLDVKEKVTTANGNVSEKHQKDAIEFVEENDLNKVFLEEYQLYQLGTAKGCDPGNEIDSDVLMSWLTKLVNIT